MVVLYANTGGGHLSAASSLIDEIRDRAPALDIQLVDVVKDYSAAFLNRTPSLYSFASRHPLFWRAWYSAGSGRRRAALADKALGWLGKRGLRRLFQDHPGALYVSVHPTLNRPLAQALARYGPPASRFATVVTDISTMSPMWFWPDVDLCLVPTSGAEELAASLGMPPDRVQLNGFPVARRFFEKPRESVCELRRELGLPVGKPVILVAGGAEGSGPILDVVRQVAGAGRDVTVVVVTGRNTVVAQQLRNRSWACDVHVLGLVADMHVWMRVADVFVTKAGPGALHEAAATGLPVVMFHCMPGQEEGNVEFMLTAAAGVWAPRPEDTVTEIFRVLDSPAHRDRLTHNASRLADPLASRRIAENLLKLARHTPARPKSDSFTDEVELPVAT